MGAILRALERAFPDARTALRYRTPFELLIATILSARCTDEMVNRVTPALFSAYPDARALAAARPQSLERVVKPTGFFRQKARAIRRCSAELVARYGGEVPRRMADLVSLPGVARKTANVVLASCFPRPASDHGIFVDTHVKRVSQRLALTTSEAPEAIEDDLLKLVPEKKWAVFPHQLVLLGRSACTARSPDHEHCPLLRWCPTGEEALRDARPATTVSHP
ncbi:MAG: endonuclease III [Labilithrix sp.]|nr:endonuclease III [Labilithrix sp.]